MIFEADVDQLNGPVDQCVRIVTQILQIGELPLEVVDELCKWVGESGCADLFESSPLAGIDGLVVAISAWIAPIDSRRLGRPIDGRSADVFWIGQIYDRLELSEHLELLHCDLDDNVELFLTCDQVHDQLCTGPAVESILKMAKMASVPVRQTQRDVGPEIPMHHTNGAGKAINSVRYCRVLPRSIVLRTVKQVSVVPKGYI